jgi:hypothetical protein
MSGCLTVCVKPVGIDNKAPEVAVATPSGLTAKRWALHWRSSPDIQPGVIGPILAATTENTTSSAAANIAMSAAAAPPADTTKSTGAFSAPDSAETAKASTDSQADKGLVTGELNAPAGPRASFKNEDTAGTTVIGACWETNREWMATLYAKDGDEATRCLAKMLEERCKGNRLVIQWISSPARVAPESVAIPCAQLSGVIRRFPFLRERGCPPYLVRGLHFILDDVKDIDSMSYEEYEEISLRDDQHSRELLRMANALSTLLASSPGQEPAAVSIYAHHIARSGDIHMFGKLLDVITHMKLDLRPFHVYVYAMVFQHRAWLLRSGFIESCELSRMVHKHFSTLTGLINAPSQEAFDTGLSLTPEFKTFFERIQNNGCIMGFVPNNIQLTDVGRTYFTQLHTGPLPLSLHV